jgi:hypothetical protein
MLRLTKTTASGAGERRGVPAAASYGRAGSLSRGLRYRQLALQTGPVFDAGSEEVRQAA